MGGQCFRELPVQWLIPCGSVELTLYALVNQNGLKDLHLVIGQWDLQLMISSSGKYALKQSD